MEVQAMKKIFIAMLGMPLLLAVLAEYSAAIEAVDSMRCGSKLVQIGDTKVDILAKCGEPTLRGKIERNTTVKKSRARSASTVEDRSRVDEQWTYNFGPQDFLYTLTFEGVELTSIGRGGRGTRR
jgi:hypothetical protein